MARDLTEMNKLEEYLKAKGICYKRTDSDNTMPQEQFEQMQKVLGRKVEPFDQHQIVVFDGEGRSWDVICHRGSYGANEGLMEGMGDLFGTDVEGWLTAADVIEMIEEAK